MTARESAAPLEWYGLCVVALVKLALHLATIRGYGIFRDELYYVACAEHLDWGYVDHAPGVAFVAAAARWIGGDSLIALRLPAALAGVATVLLTGKLVSELGGGRTAQLMAAVAVALAPFNLALNHIHSMNAFEPPLWTAMALTLARVERGAARPRDWLMFGAVAGVALLNKHSTLMFGFAAAVALLGSRHRRCYLERWPWIGAALAFVIFSPNLIWQVAHGWPTLEFSANARASKHVELSALEFAGQQVLLIGPLSALVALAGIGGAVRRPPRLLVATTAVLFVILVLARGKAYYLASAYPLLLAAGAMRLEAWTPSRAARAAGVALVAIAGLALTPLALPLLPVADFIALHERLGLAPSSGEKHEVGPLPQFFADMFGWRELALEVDSVFLSLPEADRAQLVIIAENYGEAGAIDHFGAAPGLPPAASTHNGYFLWGLPADRSAEVAIGVGGDADDYRQAYAYVVQVSESDHELAMPHERHVPIFVCKELKFPLHEAWPRFRRYR